MSWTYCGKINDSHFALLGKYRFVSNKKPYIYEWGFAFDRREYERLGLVQSNFIDVQWTEWRPKGPHETDSFSIPNGDRIRGINRAVDE